MGRWSRDTIQIFYSNQKSNKSKKNNFPTLTVVGMRDIQSQHRPTSTLLNLYMY